MVIGRVNVGSWLLRLLAWDGGLPTCIALAPFGIEILFPNRRGILELTAVGLPIIAFFLRVRAGKRHIASNQCNSLIKGVQFFAFFVAIVPLVIFDAFLILSHLMPAGPIFVAGADHVVGAILISVYLRLMAVAMYPGRIPSSLSDPWEETRDWDEFLNR